MGKLAGYNKLPPRPEYISSVLSKLDLQELSLAEIIKQTRLTRTQVACTLDVLLADKTIKVIKVNNRNYYRKINELQ